MATDKAWSRRLKVTFSKTLAGDRINLPPSVIDEFFSPASVSNGSPLTFEIVNSHTSVRVFGTVREFTAADDSVEVSAVLGKALELEDDVEGRYVTIRKVSLEKGAFAKLAPLDAEYLDISDLRSTLESHLRQNYATLTAGETISVLDISPVTHQPKEYRFLISQLQAEDNQEVPGCLIVETDIAVDIVPLDSAFAEEAVQRKRLLEQNKAGSVFAWNGNATNIIQGEVDADAYQYYHMPTLAGCVCYEIKLDALDGDADLFVSSHFDHPSERDHSHFNVDVGTSVITVKVDSSEAAFLYIGVRGYASKSRYQLMIATVHETTEHGATAPKETTEPGTRKCPNCSAQVKEQAYIMHEAFCLRNNSVCPRCKKVMTKSDYQSHWHCEKCAKVGIMSEQEKHDKFVHTPILCDCGITLPMPELAEHRKNSCTERLILCKFCHLRVRAGPASTLAKDILLGGLSEHESQCGSRTIKCHKCNQAVQLKDVPTHAKIHEHKKRLQLIYKICTNNCCSVPLDDRTPNHALMCSKCFGPFWNARADPGNQKFAQKLVFFYHQQLTRGCERQFCTNQHCATGTKAPMDPTSAALKAVELIKQSVIGNPTRPQYYLCSVAESNAYKRRLLAESLQDLGFTLAWCVKALQECRDDSEGAASWLLSNAPQNVAP
ncbi:hypothetical protein HDU85_003504 [Gaertneriomyces sp. JEL0708]|nr:hypothetical protein HDU85_003504 [Gaertneriomyces sp. JEL0708]